MLTHSNSTTGLSLKEFVEIARKFHYHVEIFPYSGFLHGSNSFFKSPYGCIIQSKHGFSDKALKKAFEQCTLD